MKQQHKIYVYFVYDTKTKLFKIGKSYNPERRLRFLQTSNINMKLIYYTDKFTENEIHKKYKHLRIKNEWFRLSKDILIEIIGNEQKIPKMLYYKSNYFDKTNTPITPLNKAETISVTYLYNVKHYVSDEICLTECGKVINVKKGIELKQFLRGKHKAVYINGCAIFVEDLKPVYRIVCPF